MAIIVTQTADNAQTHTNHEQTHTNPEFNADEFDLYTLDDLADYLRDVTPVLFMDYDPEVLSYYI